MNRSNARSAWRTLGFIASLALLPPVVAHAAPELTLAEAKSALVDLNALWTRATQDIPLAETYLTRYLTTPQSPAVLSVVPVTAEDARELYRRQAFLSLYATKHASFVTLVRSGTVPASVRIDETAVLEFAHKARAAELELYLLAWIMLADGETLEQKCAAYTRAAQHGRTLGFASATALPDTDFPPAWRPLYGRARQLSQSQDTRFRAALCSEGVPVSRAETRRALEGLLDTKLDKTLGQHFDRTAIDLEQVQQSLTELVTASTVTVPRDRILLLQKRVTDANSVYQLVSTDTYGLGARIAELSEQTQALLATMHSQQGGESAFAGPERELLALRNTLSSFLALAKSLGTLRLPSAADNTALSICSSLPERVDLAGTGADLASTVNGCLSAALSIRERLLAGSSVPPERTELVRHLQALSTSFLNNNRF
jgi:hypothetical protein